VFGTSVVDEVGGRLGKADAIIEIFHGAPFFTPLWSRKPQVAFVHHVHLGTWHLLLPGVLGRIGDALERYGTPLVYRSRAMVAPSESARQEILRHYRTRPDRTYVAPNGVAERFRPGGSLAPRPLAVAVARFMPQKRLDELVRVLVAAKQQVPDLDAVIVGDGPERDRVHALVRELGAEEWLRLPGRLDDDDVVGWYQRAWVVVSASLREGFGLTLTEAGACGTPGVATRIPGHVDAVDDGVSGLLADDFDELAAALVTVLRDPELRDKLAQGALDHAQQFSWEAATAAVLDALCDEVDRARTRPRLRFRALGR
jgi:glycosyltransferase involved in cell wall biosynthesis